MACPNPLKASQKLFSLYTEIPGHADLQITGTYNNGKIKACLSHLRATFYAGIVVCPIQQQHLLSFFTVRVG
jgi:hypothetical protein